jgi:ribosomal protein S18 acetylase RimI-like enzyme
LGEKKMKKSPNPLIPAKIVRLTAVEVGEVGAELQQVYAVTFTRPPYNESVSDAARFPAMLAQHAQREGFRCFVARQEDDGRIVGMAYGYTCLPGQWWCEKVAGALTATAARRWLEDSFEFAELAVVPELQGQRLGSRLHDTLLASLSHRTAVLSTIQAETVAMHLYRKRCWLTLRSGFTFPNSGRHYVIMGRRLR